MRKVEDGRTRELRDEEEVSLAAWAGSCPTTYIRHEPHVPSIRKSAAGALQPIVSCQISTHVTSMYSQI